jgi:hypothetical protein
MYMGRGFFVKISWKVPSARSGVTTCLKLLCGKGEGRRPFAFFGEREADFGLVMGETRFPFMFLRTAADLRSPD